MRQSPRKTIPLLVPLDRKFTDEARENHLVIENIASYCSWSTLVKFANAYGGFRRPIYTRVRNRAKYFLFNFFSMNSTYDFWRIMADTHSAIIGGTVRCIMMLDDIYVHAHPDQLDIVVPTSDETASWNMWSRFLAGQGYEEKASDWYVNNKYSFSVSRWARLVHVSLLCLVFKKFC